ncbi:MAG: hypothetical protein LRY66_14700 [Saccharospirillaceae bacterium]|nr:hypothetical protein [Saccharospirillaceae bacterium]
MIRPTLWRQAVLPAAIALASFSAQADQAEKSAVDLSKMVVSAAGFEQKIVEAPASISVITQEELRSRPYMTLLDAVRELEGVDIGETRDKTGQGVGQYPRHGSRLHSAADRRTPAEQSRRYLPE